MPIDSDTLLRGSLTYLRHARLFQRDAVDLYERERFAAAVVLSTISLEHTAAATWLYESSKTPQIPESMTSKSLAYSLSKKINHSQKMDRGLRTFTYIRNAKRMEELILKLASVALGSEEHVALGDEHEQILSDERKTFPGHIHRLRTAAQYVNFDGRTNEWNIENVTRATAQLTVLTAGKQLRLAGQWPTTHR